MIGFKGFKKIATDATKTTFAHPNGNQLIVAHKSLDPKTLESLHSLPMHSAEAPKPKGYSGEDAEPADQVVSEDAPLLTKVGRYARDTVKGAISDAEAPLEAAGSAIGSVRDAVGSGVSQLVEGASGGNGAPAQSPAAAPAPTNVSLGPQSSPGQPATLSPPTTPFKYDPYAGVNTSMAGNTAEAKAIGDLENQKAQRYQKYNDDLQNLNYQSQMNAANNQKETQAAIQDMKNSHIDPRAYINNMGAGQKTATAIGLILGGIGGGVLGTGGNVAMDFLNKQISNDVEAQRANRDNKMTVFNAMQKQFGNQQDAIKMTQAFYTAKLQNEINEAAAKAGTPLAAARAQQMNGPLEQQLNQLHYEVGMRQAAMKGLSGGADAAAAIPYLVPKEQQQKAMEAYGKIQELNQLHQNMNESADHLSGQLLKGALSPNDTASAKQAFAGAVQKMSEGRYNEDAANKIVTSLLPQMTDSAATLSNKEKRRDEFFNSFTKEHAAILNSHFVPIPQMPPRFKKR